MRTDLVNDEDALFSEDTFKEITHANYAIGAVQYYTKMYGRFRNQLKERGWTKEEIDDITNTHWRRIIEACIKYNVSLTPTAKNIADRLGYRVG